MNPSRDGKQLHATLNVKGRVPFSYPFSYPQRFDPHARRRRQGLLSQADRPPRRNGPKQKTMPRLCSCFAKGVVRTL